MKTNEKTILLCEDEHITQNILLFLFTKEGYTTILAKDGFEACALYVKHKSSIDLVVMDGQMPKVDGFVATRYIRSINKTVPVIVYSAGLTHKSDSFLEAGCNTFVPKNGYGKTLISAIKNYI